MGLERVGDKLERHGSLDAGVDHSIIWQLGISMTTAHLVLVILAAVSFGLKAANAKVSIDLMNLGFCFLTIAMLVK